MYSGEPRTRSSSLTSTAPGFCRLGRKSLRSRIVSLSTTSTFHNTHAMVSSVAPSSRIAVSYDAMSSSRAAGSSAIPSRATRKSATDETPGTTPNQHGNEHASGVLMISATVNPLEGTSVSLESGSVAGVFVRRTGACGVALALMPGVDVSNAGCCIPIDATRVGVAFWFSEPPRTHAPEPTKMRSTAKIATCLIRHPPWRGIPQYQCKSRRFY